MVAMLDIHEQREQELIKELQEIEAQHKPLHEENTKLALRTLDLTMEMWGIKMQQILPGVPITEEELIVEVTPQNNVNDAPRLLQMLKEKHVTVTHIKHDKKRNTYRIYGSLLTPVSS